MSYLALKHLHMSCAALTLLLFLLRTRLAFVYPDWRQRWPVLRWLPHANDTVLLAAGVGLMLWSGQYPGALTWLTAKLVALLLYIGAGKRALAPGLAPGRRAAWLAVALACVGYILAVATTRNALPGA